MVDTSIEAVTKLLDGVTPGPWTVRLAYDDDRAVIDGTGFPVAYDVASADRRFIAAARDLVPALLAERDALKKERDEAMEGWHVIHPNITVQDAARVLLTAREQGQIDVEAVKLFLKGQPVAALRAIAEGRE